MHHHGLTGSTTVWTVCAAHIAATIGRLIALSLSQIALARRPRLITCNSRATFILKPVRQMVWTSATLCRYNSNEYLTASGSRFNYATEAAAKSGNFVGRRRASKRQTRRQRRRAAANCVGGFPAGRQMARNRRRCSVHQTGDLRSTQFTSAGGSRRSAADPTWIKRTDRAMSLMWITVRFWSPHKWDTAYMFVSFRLPVADLNK